MTWTLQTDDPWDPITVAYAQAVAVMQARPASDPTSWTYQAAIHGSYVPPPPGARWNECQHQSWYFLSWHRMYVYYLERIVRAAVRSVGGPDDFALPYWNYDQPFPANTLPRPFREPTPLLPNRRSWRLRRNSPSADRRCPPGRVLTVPASTRSLLAGAGVAAQTMYLNVEDIEAERNPGIVYGVFVNMPSDDPAADRARYHVGNIALFGIETMNDPDAAHGGVPGFRHTFDITRVVGELREAGGWEPNAITVTFEPITPIPPPGEEGLAGAFAEETDVTPVRIGRISLFVG